MEDEEATSIHHSINIKPEDFMDTCRVCMDRNEEMNSIFDSKNDSIVDRVQFCTGIQFTIDDGLPSQICNACIQNLTVSHKFKTSCLQSEELFRKILQDNIKEEPDDDFNDLVQYDDDDDGIKVKDEVLETVLNENVRKTRVRLKKEEIDSTVDKEIKRQKKVRGPYKKSKPKRMKKYKFTRLTCEPCNMKFKTKLESDEHKKLAHKVTSWVCEVCGKVFSHQASHYSHMRAHLPPKYGCEQCDYKTSHKHDLVKHLHIHSDIKLFQCEFCSSSYRTSSNLTGHIRRFHEGLKRFQCTMCDRKFYDRTKLNRHIDSHNDIKRSCTTLFHEEQKCFICTMCDRRFYDRTKLNRHIDSHNEFKRYECEVCHSFFTRRCYWKKHLERQHGVVVPAQRPGRQRMNEQIGEFKPNNGTITRLFTDQSLTTEN